MVTDGTCFKKSFPLLSVDEHYYLREHRMDDAESFRDYYHDREVNQYVLMPVPETVAEARSRMAMRMSYFKQQDGMYWALAHKESEKMRGSIAIFNLNIYLCSAVLAYDLDRQLWGSGMALKMGRAVLDYAFGQLGLVRLYADILPQNLRSQKFVKKLGFQYEGLGRKFCRFNDDFYDMQIYSMTDDDYAKRA